MEPNKKTKLMTRFALFRKWIKRKFKYHLYPSRVLAVVVWCLVLWSLLGEDSFPAAATNDCERALANYSVIPMDKLRETVMSITKNSYIISLYFPIGIVAIDGSSAYKILLIDKRVECDVRNIQTVTVYGELSDLHILNNSEFLYQFNFTNDDLFDVPAGNSLLFFPSGHFFALVVLGIVSSLMGFLVKFCCLPPLVGMIIAGFMLRNLPIVLIGQISPVWSSVIRNVALVIVLVRGGLALNFKKLNHLKIAFVMLAFIPCVLEGTLEGIIATFYLQLPWQWGFLLGFVVAAISPAIVVPTTLILQEKGYGVVKGIPTLIIGAASFDVVISISLFGVFLGLAFSEGNVVLDIFRAPIQVIIGLLYGILFGIVLWILPLRTKFYVSQHGNKPRGSTDAAVEILMDAVLNIIMPRMRMRSEKTSHIERGRFVILFGLSLFAVFGSRRAILGGSSLAGSGPLAVVILSFTAGLKWKSNEKKSISRLFYLMWQIAQPLLFGLIGAELDITFISPSLVGQAFVLLICGLVLRTLSSLIVLTRSGFSWKEKIFVAIAWIPKATVQAAVGSIALDAALMRNDSVEDISRARIVLTIAVLAIFLTAPLGGIAISLLGPVLLCKEKTEEAVAQELETDNTEETNKVHSCEKSVIHKETCV